MTPNTSNPAPSRTCRAAARTTLIERSAPRIAPPPSPRSSRGDAPNPANAFAPRIRKSDSKARSGRHAEDIRTRKGVREGNPIRMPLTESAAPQSNADTARGNRTSMTILVAPASGGSRPDSAATTFPADTNEVPRTVRRRKDLRPERRKASIDDGGYGLSPGTRPSSRAFCSSAGDARAAPGEGSK